MEPDPAAAQPELAHLPPAVTAFLRRLPTGAASGAAATPLPDLADRDRQVQPHDDLPARFTQAAQAAGMHVRPAGPATWCDVVRDVLRACGAKTVFLGPLADSALDPERAAALSAALAAGGFSVCRTPDDQTLFTVDAAVTGASAAIAETGTIVWPSGADAARGATLIPPIHVAVVGVEQILPDLCDYFARCAADAPPPANLTLISGPSKTADIEGILITGVHGPGQVHIVLIAPQTHERRPPPP